MEEGRYPRGIMATVAEKILAVSRNPAASQGTRLTLDQLVQIRNGTGGSLNAPVAGACSISHDVDPSGFPDFHPNLGQSRAGRREDNQYTSTTEFRAILDGMTPAQRAVYVALCKEPTKELYSRPYMRRHGIRGPGSVDGAVRTLADLGELETGNDGPRPTDPLFAAWVRERLGKFW